MHNIQAASPRNSQIPGRFLQVTSPPDFAYTGTGTFMEVVSTTAKSKKFILAFYPSSTPTATTNEGSE
jgi:hypothetical protein